MPWLLPEGARRGKFSEYPKQYLFHLGVTVDKYLLLRKIAQGASLVVAMSLIVFVIFRLMPGNPAELLIKSYTRGQLTVQQKLAIKESLGLAGGKWTLSNFDNYMYQMYTFHFGLDYTHPGRTVAGEIADALPFTLILIGTTAILSFALGIPLGVMVSRIRGGKKEGAILTISLILTSIPYFILGVFLFLYFTVYIRAFPIKTIIPLSYIYQPTLSSIYIIIRAMFLPFLSLLIVEATGHMITMRASMVSTLGEDHIITARAKGVPERSILRKHAARVAMIPVTTRMALELSALMSGSLIVAIIFDWPGMGPLLYHAVLEEDYPLTEASTFIIALLTIFAYSITDYIQAWLDPRIQI